MHETALYPSPFNMVLYITMPIPMRVVMTEITMLLSEYRTQMLGDIIKGKHFI